MKKAGTSERNKDSVSSGEAGKGRNNEKQLMQKETQTEEKVDLDEKSDKDVPAEVGKDFQGKEASGAEASPAVKPAKKKIVRKIVKQKVADTKAVVSPDNQQNEKTAEKGAEDDKMNSEGATIQPEEQLGSSSGVKTFIRKKVIKKVPVAKKSQKKDMQAEVKDQMEVEGNEGELPETVQVNSAVEKQDSTAKTTVKRKIIKKVPKKKSGTDEATNCLSKDGDQNVSAEGNLDKAAADVEKQNDEADKQEQNSMPKPKLQPVVPEKKDSNGSARAEIKGDSKNVALNDVHVEKNLQEKEKLNADKNKRDTKRDESTRKSDEDMKEKRKLEEPPRPGFILCTKGNKDHKVC